MMSLVLSGFHLAWSWRQQGLQGHLQLVKALGHHQFCDEGAKGKRPARLATSYLAPILSPASCPKIHNLVP